MATNIDHEGNARGECEIHPPNLFGQCLKYWKRDEDNSCKRCGCVARLHKLITTCSQCRRCPGFEPGHRGHCYNCNCLHQHGAIVADPEVEEPAIDWNQISKAAQKARTGRSHGGSSTASRTKKLKEGREGSDGGGRRGKKTKKMDFEKFIHVEALKKVGSGFKFRERGMPREQLSVKPTDTIHQVKDKCRQSFKIPSSTACTLMPSKKGPILKDTAEILQDVNRKIFFCSWDSSDEEETQDSSSPLVDVGLQLPQHTPVTIPATPVPIPATPNELVQLGMTVQRHEKDESCPATVQYLQLGQQWSKQELIRVNINLQPIASGSMRDAFDVTVVNGCSLFPAGKRLVAKRYKYELQWSKSNEQMLRKDIQTQECVRGLVKDFNAQCTQSNVPGRMLRVLPIYLMHIVDAPTDWTYFSIEEYMHGQFSKTLNNTGMELQGKGFFQQNGTPLVSRRAV